MTFFKTRETFKNHIKLNVQVEQEDNGSFQTLMDFKNDFQIWGRLNQFSGIA